MHRLKLLTGVWLTVVAMVLLPRVASAEDDVQPRKVTIQILGGKKRTPLNDLKLSLSKNRPKDRPEFVIAGKSDSHGRATFSLSPGTYYVHFESDSVVPFLDIPIGYKGHPNWHSNQFKVTSADASKDMEQQVTFNMADACKLSLRAVDEATGKGIAGVDFATENAVGEYWAQAIQPETIGYAYIEYLDADKKRAMLTNDEGYFHQYIGPRPGWTYFLWTIPPGYVAVEPGKEVTLETPNGTLKVEHVFKLRKKASD